MTKQTAPCGNKGCPYHNTGFDCFCSDVGPEICKEYTPDPTEEMYMIQDCINTGFEQGDK